MPKYEKTFVNQVDLVLILPDFNRTLVNETYENTSNVEKIPGALRQRLGEDDLEGNPVVVMIRLKQ